MLTLAEFLLDRIAEDAVALRQPLSRPMSTAEAAPTADASRAQLMEDIAVKRATIQLHVPRNPDSVAVDGVVIGICAQCSRMLPCPTLKALALSYADHPEYRNEWRP